MVKKKKIDWSGIGIVLFIVAISILDIFFNVISLIPIIGDVLETFSETIMEALTIISTLVLYYRGGKK